MTVYLLFCVFSLQILASYRSSAFSKHSTAAGRLEKAGTEVPSLPQNKIIGKETLI